MFLLATAATIVFAVLAYSLTIAKNATQGHFRKLFSQATLAAWWFFTSSIFSLLASVMTSENKTTQAETLELLSFGTAFVGTLIFIFVSKEMISFGKTYGFKNTNFIKRLKKTHGQTLETQNERKA